MIKRDAASHVRAALVESPPRRPEFQVLDEIDLLINAYEIDIECSRCTATAKRSISWVHKRYVMNCPECDSVIVLRTSTMNEDIRRVTRQMRELQTQLLQTVGRANAILGR